MDRIGKAIQDEGRTAVLRKIGGLLFGIGMFTVFMRKGGENFGDQWGNLPLFLVLAIPAVVLFGLGLRGDRFRPVGRVVGDLQPWRSVFLVFGIVFVSMALLQFVELIGGTPGAALNIAWIFGVTGVLALIASRDADASYMTLLGGIALIVAWSALAHKVFDIGEHLGTYRWLMIAFAALLAFAAMSIRSRAEGVDLKRSNELVTVAGIAAVIGAGLGIGKLAGSLTGGLAGPDVDSSLLWEMVLLGVAVALVAYGSYAGARGPALVGGIAVFMFVIVAGLDYNDSTPENKLLGWPVFLVIIGLLALLASLRPERRAPRPRQTPEAPADPGAGAGPGPAPSSP